MISLSRRQRGFSVIELLSVAMIMMIITAFAVPSVLQAYRSYRLSDIAAQLEGVMNFARLEAIRRNTVINLRTAASGALWNVWADSNKDGALNSGEKRLLTTSPANLLAAASVPGTASLNTAAGISSPTVLSGTAGTIPYDSRGAITPAAVYVMYIGNASNAAPGYRAVILFPSGITEAWAGTGTGVWRQIN